MFSPTRRNGLAGLGLLATAALGARRAEAAASLEPAGAKTLHALTEHLAGAPKRRDFKTVPMILDNRELWDAEALNAVLTYAGGPKQCWDNTDLAGPWLNVMRNSMNNQVWSFKHPDFLCVSATHGSAQFALYDDAIWEKYGLAKLAGGKITSNTFLKAPAAADKDPAHFQDPDGAFSPAANSIQALQRRGAVFLACHNAIWEQCARLMKDGTNPDHLSIEAMCAELTNHLNPGVVLTPGAVGTIVELETHGFVYTR